MTAGGAGGAVPLFLIIGANGVAIIQALITGLALACPMIARGGQRRVLVAAYLLLTTQLAGLMGMMAYTGGLVSAPFFALSILPLCAVFLLGIKHGAVWTGITVVAIGVTISLDQAGLVQYENHIPISVWAVVHGSGPIFFTLLLFGFARLYTGERDDALARLSAANRRIAGEFGVLEAQFEAGFQGAPIGMAMLGLDGGMQRVNPALCRILGKNRLDLLSCDLKSLSHPEDAPVAIAQLSSLTQGLEQQLQYDQRFQRGEETVWARVSFALLRDNKGNAHTVFAQIEDVTEHTLAEEQLAHRASHDALTNLPARALFIEELSRRLTELDGTKELAVLFVDVDQFKFINDGLGHSIGDALLVQIARRLKDCAGEHAMVTRIGGDEFAVLSPVYDGGAFLSDNARWLHEGFRQPLMVDGQPMHVTVSVGIARCSERSTEPEGLLRHADAAMYEAKQAGRATTRWATQATQARLRDQYEMSRMLASAIENNEFVLHYQPEVGVMSGDLVGLEALVRWVHPTDGLLEAGRFIQLAEETGLIVRLGSWVLAEGMRQAAEWNHAGHKVIVRINVAASQLRQPGFVAEVKTQLEASQAPASAICLEITESALLDMTNATAQRLDDLRALGLRLAIDDFGTGYASLAYLKHIPAHELKIDKSFVRQLEQNPKDLAIIETILQLADKLDFDVVAEGVENSAQLQQLRSLGCQTAQGYMLGRPVSASTILKNWFGGA